MPPWNIWVCPQKCPETPPLSVDLGWDEPTPVPFSPLPVCPGCKGYRTGAFMNKHHCWDCGKVW